jgi:hypothetical protein
VKISFLSEQIFKMKNNKIAKEVKTISKSKDDLSQGEFFHLDFPAVS